MRRKATTTLKYDDVKSGKGGSKDLDMSPFAVMELLLNPFAKDKSISDRVNLMFQDADLMPLMIQENYINFKPTSAGGDEAKRMVHLAPSLARPLLVRTVSPTTPREGVGSQMSFELNV
jgi:hypothetical protein